MSKTTEYILKNQTNMVNEYIDDEYHSNEYQEKLVRLKNILSVPTKTWEEDDLIEYIVTNTKDFDTMDIDDLGNIYITKGKADHYPCFVAHLDSVHEKVDMVVEEEMLPNAQGEPKVALKAYEKISGEPTGIGGDDKAGVFICLELLKEIDACKIFLPVAEETGCHGSKEADKDFFKDVGYALQFDSTENNTMSLSLMGVKLFKENSEFINKTKDVILEHGITEWLNHPYTDTMMLKKKFDFSCLNFAAGYYNYHTKNEYVVIEDVFNALTLGKKVTNILGENKYKYKSKPTNHFNLF
tara:strand:- start:450 stop:1343 length:894 start_codon:yes stop_codon:yes gene_type:complete